jgi:hypothetical protein
MSDLFYLVMIGRSFGLSLLFYSILGVSEEDWDELAKNLFGLTNELLINEMYLGAWRS